MEAIERGIQGATRGYKGGVGWIWRPVSVKDREYINEVLGRRKPNNGNISGLTSPMMSKMLKSPSINLGPG